MVNEDAGNGRDVGGRKRPYDDRCTERPFALKMKEGATSQGMKNNSRRSTGQGASRRNQPCRHLDLSPLNLSRDV